jgi:Tfp pilus assembly protein PilP
MTMIVRLIVCAVAFAFFPATPVSAQGQKRTAQPKQTAPARAPAAPAARPKQTAPAAVHTPPQNQAARPKQTAPVAAPTPAAPVAPAAPAASAVPPAPATPDASAATGAPPAVEPQGYTYDPQGRRDPFVSLLRRGSDLTRATGPGARPNGLAGLETGEVTLKGTVASQGTYVGILQGSDQKTYIVKAGDRLLDGTIRAITPDSMVITQLVTDPLSLEKQREVRKLLRQTEEAK